MPEEITLQAQRDSNSDPKRAAFSDWGYIIVGPRREDVKIKITGLKSTANPSVVIFQPRQTQKRDDWSDQFAIMVIKTAPGEITIRVRRLDSPGGPWGQNLRVDFLIIN